MNGNAKELKKSNFGDFQTPVDLARRICSLLVDLGIESASVLEPTCGQGSFIVAALEVLSSVQQVVGIDINPGHLDDASRAVTKSPGDPRIELRHDDIFRIDWSAVVEDIAKPVLVLGNLPWVTNASLGQSGSRNLPQKTNFQGHAGLDAITGKSNFDISEWMAIRLVEVLRDVDSTIAILLKTAVARKVLRHAWKLNIPVGEARIYGINAAKNFDAAVEACLFVCRTNTPGECQCWEFDSLDSAQASSSFGFADGRVIADLGTYQRLHHLVSHRKQGWRSGIKHDCSKVMELRLDDDGQMQNGLGEAVDIEEHVAFPMLKSSEVANPKKRQARRYMLVTQSSVGQDTSHLENSAPKAWAYLNKHAARLGNRKSSIYRKRPQFSIFGIGDYSFTPWKVAISGFYKSLKFRVIAPRAGRPVVLDDTVYFYPCHSKKEAELIQRLLHSDAASAFLNSLIFWDAKRPVTIEVLELLSLEALAKEHGCLDEFTLHSCRNQDDQRELSL